MARTISIQGSDEVMAMYGARGVYYRGKWENIRITGVSEDEDVPSEVRRSVVGLVIPTIFTRESIVAQTGKDFSIPAQSRLAYVPDVIAALTSAGRIEAATQLEAVASSPLDMYVFEKAIYELSE